MKTLKSGLVKQSGTIKKWSMLSPAMIVVTVAFFIPLIMLFALSLYRGIAGTGFVDKTELPWRILPRYSLHIMLEFSGAPSA